jgi:uncharacterized protein (DUF2164 family)
MVFFYKNPVEDYFLFMENKVKNHFKGLIPLFIKFSKQEKESMIAEIQRYFYEERNEEIGNLAAENVLEFFKDQIGPYFYNEALKDARKVIEQKMSSIEEDLFALEKKNK